MVLDYALGVFEVSPRELVGHAHEGLVLYMACEYDAPAVGG
jgi:hypothetical protein